MFEITLDVLFIGAGPASLSSAYFLKQLINEYNEENPDKKLPDITIGVFEKSHSIGEHILSGAVLDPHILDELMLHWRDSAPVKTYVTKDDVYFLKKDGQIHFPIPPPGMENQGYYIISLAELVKWLGKKCEEAGIEIFTSEPVKDIIYSEDGKVIGVKTGEKGLDKEGNQKSNFLPGAEIGAKVVVAGEGSRGFITKKLADKFNLNAACNPQQYATGVKELWEVRPENFTRGRVMHTIGYPLDLKTFGGGFVYHIKDNVVALGLAVALDYESPYLNLQEELQKFKTQPLIKGVISGGKLLEYGAKTISEGGYYSIGRLSGDGFMLIGEGAGLLNSKKLKGIHLAIASGIAAARTVFEAIKADDFSRNKLSVYDHKIKESWVGRELHSIRNFHQGFQRGLFTGMINTGLQMISGGRGLVEKFKVEEDYLHMKKISAISSPLAGEGKSGGGFKPDGALTFKRVDEVYFSGTKHEENQPNHLKIKDLSICNGKCIEEYGNPCTRFCPAEVYEMEDINDDSAQPVGANGVRPSSGKKSLKMNPSNCLHCKTCEIKDPYNVIEWTPPEGGGGPGYKKM